MSYSWSEPTYKSGPTIGDVGAFVGPDTFPLSSLLVLFPHVFPINSACAWEPFGQVFIARGWQKHFSYSSCSVSSPGGQNEWKAPVINEYLQSETEAVAEIFNGSLNSRTSTPPWHEWVGHAVGKPLRRDLVDTVLFFTPLAETTLKAAVRMISNV